VRVEGLLRVRVFGGCWRDRLVGRGWVENRDKKAYQAMERAYEKEVAEVRRAMMVLRAAED
jgi:hypothetical protein